MSESKVSVVMPAKNEGSAIGEVIEAIRRYAPDAEILVVDDGSTDDTASIAEAAGARVLSHRYCIGNGAAIKTGARLASGDVIVFMDADGQHDPADIPRLLAPIDEGFEMAVGARGSNAHASKGRGFANRLYNRLAAYMAGQKVHDLTSGFRAVKANKFREFLYLLPNGFSYPTTSTMAFFRAGYSVAYVSITAAQRIGISHIQPVKDGLRFLLIIFKIGTLYFAIETIFPRRILSCDPWRWVLRLHILDGGAAVDRDIILIRQCLPNAQIAVIDEGSTDETAAIAESASAEVIRPRYSKGNGAAIRNPEQAAVGVTILQISCQLEHDADHAEMARQLVQDLKIAQYSHATFGGLSALYELVLDGRCPQLDSDNIYRMAESLLENPRYYLPIVRHNLHVLMARIGMERGDLDLTMTHMETALARYPDLNTLGLSLGILTSAGLQEMSLELLGEAEQWQPRLPVRARRWDRRVDLLKQISAQAR